MRLFFGRSVMKRYPEKRRFFCDPLKEKTVTLQEKEEYTVREYVCSWRPEAMEEEKRNCYYRSVKNKEGFENAAKLEEDRRLMESYFPQKAGSLKALVTDCCDRLDYEGSFIYDQYPDKRNMERICREIYARAWEAPEVTLTQTGETGREGELLEDFVTVLFCQEIGRRRGVRKLLGDWD